MHFDQALEDALDACLDFLLVQDVEGLARVRATLAVSAKTIAAMDGQQLDELRRVFARDVTIIQAGAEKDALLNVRAVARALLRARSRPSENT